VCTQGINLFRLLALYLKPILPRLAAGAERFLGLPDQRWDDGAQPLLGRAIGAYEPLATRVDPKTTEALIAASSESLKPSATASAVTAATPAAASGEPAADRGGAGPVSTISIDEFAKVDLRIARIVEEARTSC
jgi:methionyl-tRNA synthetase